MPDRIADAAVRARVAGIKQRLDAGLAAVDPHHRLVGRPITYHVISGRTVEVTFRDVVRIDEAEVLGVQRLIAEPCGWSVTPQGPETVTVRFVVPLEDGAGGG